MSAVVCRKRSNFFEESPSSSPVTKRNRYLSSSSSFSGRAFSPPRVAASQACSSSNSSPSLDHLVDLFPDMDRQYLEKALEESGDDLDTAIKRLNELRLSVAESVSDVPQEIGAQFSAQGPVANSVEIEESSGGSSMPGNGAEWVELLVREVLFNASNVEDAKARVAQALEALEKSICANVNKEAAQSFHKENLMLKLQLEAVIHENTILKRAVFIQHEQQEEFEERGEELNKVKLLVSQYQEQVRTLEVNNCALAMHLKQAQQNSSICGSFRPDVF